MMEQRGQGDRSAAQRFVCPACGRYLGTADGAYSEYPPCACGFQTTVRAVGRRARIGVGEPPIEVKAAPAGR